MKYNRCTRCELNYIPDTEQYCEICKKEMSGKYTDYDIILDENICPYCEKNKLDFGEEMCTACKNRKILKDKKNSL